MEVVLDVNDYNKEIENGDWINIINLDGYNVIL